MPFAHARSLRGVLWIAVAALVLPFALSLSELGTGGVRTWIRLGALLVGVVAVSVALRRQASLEESVRRREQLDEALRLSEAKFSGILAIAADAIISVDPSQRIVHFNRGAEQIFGYSASEAIGRHLGVLIPARYRAGHDGQMEGFARAPEGARRMGERREIFGLRSDGTEFPAEASISKLIAPDGMLFTVVLRDITDRRRAEQDERFLAAASATLARSLDVEAALQAIADLPVPRLADACLVDIVAGNSFRRLPSASQRESLTPALRALAAHHMTWDSPSPIVDAIRRERRELVTAMDDDWFDGNEDPAAIPHWRALGAHSLLILPLAASDDTRVVLTLIAADPRCSFTPEHRALADKFAAAAATTLQNTRLYAAAQQANRARDDVLSVVSHDLRNPISAIAMCARVLRDDPPQDAEKRRALLATIGESTEWMNRLIQDLVDVASIERGQLSLAIQPQNPAELVQQALHMFEVEAAEHGITIRTDTPDELPLVSADGARIVQVLSNLIRNAIKFTPRGGEIVLTVERRDGSVVLSVSDNGAGIDVEMQPHVFDRYWESSSGSRSPGTGLGLWIAKGIVDAHRGVLEVHSAARQGSTFSIALPIAPL
ncbi:MAG: Sensory box histidine kinase [Gemmatimonadetes bacterium]|nr:Sensory box histidine kinase [Gemmatimonadota bacterium]